MTEKTPTVLANGPLTGGCGGKYGLKQVSQVRIPRGLWHLGLCPAGKDRAQQDFSSGSSPAADSIPEKGFATPLSSSHH